MSSDETPEFQDWLSADMPTWTWTWPHQLLIFERLRKITDGTAKRLMIFMPPRHSKSETVTVRYTAWRLIREPKMNVIVGSYNQRLANRFSRKIRRIVEGHIPLSKERKAVDEWETTSGGGLCAVGVGSGVTGYGAQLIMIDDPVKNRAEAESRTRRETAWDWFNDDIYTRLEPGASIVLIQTRWHEDDLAGRLIIEAANGGENWEMLSLPALAYAGAADAMDPLSRAEGEPLCPARYDREELLRIKRKIGSYAFAALYQQSPIPRDGGIFKRGWFSQIAERAPDGLRWFRAYDLAVSTKTSADYTASFRCAKDANGDLYISDGFRDRIEFPAQRRYIIDRMRTERDTIHGIEDALHARAFVQELRCESSLSRISFRAVRVDSDKFTRALTWSPLAEEGKVILVRGPWINDFLDEVCSFPRGRHDDQVDAVSLAVQMMSESPKRSKGF